MRFLTSYVTVIFSKKKIKAFPRRVFISCFVGTRTEVSHDVSCCLLLAYFDPEFLHKGGWASLWLVETRDVILLLFS